MKKLNAIISKQKSYHVYVKPKVETFENLESVMLTLSTLLSNDIALFVKTRKFDLNVSREKSLELNTLFQMHYELLEESIKEVTERINKLGCKPIDTVKEFLELSYIKEESKQYPSSKEMANELLIDHETIIDHLRNDIGNIYEKYNDADTADFLISRIEAHETMATILGKATNSQSHYLMTFYN